MTSPTRRLAAIMFTDIVGYTALMAESEERGLRARERHRALVRPLVERYHGEWIEARGDESLSTFPTALDAVNCALAIEAAACDDADLKLHVGIHLGDVVVQDGEVSGDGVNIASRICALSQGGGLCISGEVYQSIRNQPEMEAVSLGDHELKNVGRLVSVYALGRPGAVSVTAPSKVRAGTRLRYAAAALVLVGLTALAWWSWNRTWMTAGPIRSIAVLPLLNLSGDPEQTYFVDGMTDALIAELAKIRSLRVISRTSVMQYKGTTKTAPEIAQELGVDGLIEGSVLRDGDQVRITAQLIHGPTDRHLWAESYTNTMTNVLGLHSEVALAITSAVGAILTPEESRRIASPRSVHPEAYEAYVLGMHFWGVKTDEGLRTAIRHLGRATELDPGFALAWARISSAYGQLAGWSIDKPRDAGPLARRAALRALELDSELGQAYKALAQVAHIFDWEWSEAERLFRRAIELAPNDAQIHSEYAWLLLQIGRYPEAVSQAEFSLELDPKSHAIRRDAATVFRMSGDPERGWALLKEVYSEDPSYIPVLDSIFHFHIMGGDPDKAIRTAEEYRSASPDEPWPQLLLAFGHAVAGDPEKAHELVDTARRIFGEERLASTTLGEIHVALGEMDDAFRVFERGFDEREWLMTWLRVGPYLNRPDARLRRDPRYWELMRRMNFPPFPPDHPGYAEEQAQQAGHS